MNTEDATAMQIVRLGYALDDPTDAQRCLAFRVGFNDAEFAAAAAESIGSYTDYSGASVAAAIRAAVAHVRYPRVAVGREGSPVVYVSVWGGKDEAVAVMAALKLAGPDELSFDGTEVRAWWD